ncbi:hypothetical protein [uncultured Solobacterium sp.]|uniref:hypothetical protein n=1 Tax=uncultured Solobacterium sp. TaxID=747375 RepID=UPI0028DCB07B|nr:hypothetical protein [uncultured Solobacterium sp.]
MDLSNTTFVTLIGMIISAVVTLVVCNRNFKFKKDQKVFETNIDLLLKIKATTFNLADFLEYPPLHKTELKTNPESPVYYDSNGEILSNEEVIHYTLLKELIFRLYDAACMANELTNNLIGIEIPSVHELYKKVYYICKIKIENRKLPDSQKLIDDLRKQISETNNDIKKCIVDYKPKFFKLKNLIKIDIIRQIKVFYLG